MAKIASYRILMFRSGPTEWDDSGRVQGSTDLPLAASGQLRVQDEIARLGPCSLSKVLCAPDEASLETARMLADATGASVQKLKGCCEIDFGLWEGMLRSELDGRFCRAGRQWDDDPTCITPPEGEPVEAYIGRVLPVISRATLKAAEAAVGTGANGESGGVGLVLRPVSDALVRCVLAGRPTSELVSVIEARPHAQWFEVQAERPWELIPGPRRTTSVSAA